MPTMKNRTQSPPDFPVTSLQHAMGQRSEKGYGGTKKVAPLPDELHGTGGKSGKGKGLRSTAGYDVQTRVSLGGKGKGPTPKMPKAARAAKKR